MIRLQGFSSGSMLAQLPDYWEVLTKLIMLTTTLGPFRKCEIVLCGKVVCLLPVTDHKEPRLSM